MIQKLKTTTILKEWLETINLIIDSKVDKVEGKALSTNDFTNELKTKLESIITATADTEGLVKLSDSITSESGVAGGYAATPLAVNYAYKLAEEAKAIAEQAKTLGISAYKYVGSVATENDLPTEENEVGNVYNVEETGMNYAWNGSEWDSLGASIITVDTIVQPDSNNPVSSNAVYNAINNIFESEAVFTAGVKTNTLTIENDIILSNNESTPIITLEHQNNGTEIQPAYMVMTDGDSTLTISPTTIEFSNGNSISESDNGTGLYIPTLEVGTLYTEEGIDGNAATATKLETPITITIDGDASGSVSFDGSEDVTIEVEIADDSHNHTIDTIENLQNLLDEKAPINSPEFTGVPTAPTASSETSSTQIATTEFVQSLVDSKISAADAMIFKGTIGDGGTITILPAEHKVGWTYKVITAGTYAGVNCEIGDMIICLTEGTSYNNAHWTVVQSNIDGAVTGPTSAVDKRVAIFDGATGKVIKDSGFTIASSVPADAKFTDTTYDVVTDSNDGLMSSDMLIKLEGIEEGAQANAPAFSAIYLDDSKSELYEDFEAANYDNQITLYAGNGISGWRYKHNGLDFDGIRFDIDPEYFTSSDNSITISGGDVYYDETDFTYKSRPLDLVANVNLTEFDTVVSPEVIIPNEDEGYNSVELTKDNATFKYINPGSDFEMTTTFNGSGLTLSTYHNEDSDDAPTVINNLSVNVESIETNELRARTTNSSISVSSNLNASGYTVTANNFIGTASKATADAAGNVIVDTYATKAELNEAKNELESAKTYTDTAIANLVDSAPETLNTLGELATALAENEDVIEAINSTIGTKANDSEVVKLSGDQTISGTKTFSSVISGSISGNAGTATKLATAGTITLAGDATGSVAFDGSNATLTVTVVDDSHNHIIDNIDGLKTSLDEKAPINSPEFTGVPTAPTASAGTNTTQIATTAFVTSAIGSVGNSLAPVATSGSYDDLTNKPSSLKNPYSLVVNNSEGTAILSYDGSNGQNVTINASTVGLGNVTNESKATMFTNAALTGTPTAPTANIATSTNQIATTAFVQALVTNKVTDSDVMIYKGNIQTPNELPISPSVGDVYRVDTENTNYVWSGTEWTALGQTITVDDSVLENSVNPVTGGAVYTEISNLSTIYATKEELEDAIPENVNGDEYITEMDATYPENTIITLNGFEYPTGIKAIRVSLDGFVLAEGIHYEEVIVSGTSTYSNKIKLLIPSVEGMIFHVWLSPISLSVGILEDKIQIAENSASMATEAITEITDLTNRAEIAADRAEAASGASLPMVGATDTKNGVQGLVPQPLAGEHLKFLRGDGTWQTIQMESEGLSGDTYLWVASENYSEGTIINLEDFSYPHSKNAILVSLDGFLLNEGREYEEVISDESSPVSNQIKFKFDIEPDMVIRIWVAPLEAKISNFDAKIAEANNYALQSKEYYELTKEYAAEAMNLFGTVANIENNTIDVSISSFFKKTITTDTSFEFINCKADSSCCVTLVLTNGGNHIVSWSNNVYWADGTPAILTENGIDVITFFTINGGNTWYATVTITNAQSIL